MSPPQDLWERLPNEPEQWWSRFVKFLHMGKKRSIRALYADETGKQSSPPPNWLKAAKTYRWTDRVNAYDFKMSSNFHAAAQQTEQQNQIDWVARQTAQREQAWVLSRKLAEKANEMLNWPIERIEIVRERYPNGEPKATDVYLPAKWTFRDAASLLQIADQLGRLAAEMPTEYFTFAALLTKKGIDPHTVLSDMIAEFADVEHQ